MGQCAYVLLLWGLNVGLVICYKGYKGPSLPQPALLASPTLPSVARPRKS